MSFELTQEYLNEINDLLEEGKSAEVAEQLSELHPADIAEILEELNKDEVIDITENLNSDLLGEVLVQLDEDSRKDVLDTYTGKEIAEEVVENLDSDDAADLISELSEEKKLEVLSNLEDVEQAKQIANLLTHAEDTAGALMATELVKVNHNWTVMRCVGEMRRQAEDVEQVHAVYVVDNNDILLGTLSLKKLLTTSTKTPIKEVYNNKFQSVKSTTENEEVARMMQKYDMFVVPVVDEMGRLLGRITLDDVLDFIKEEADRDYQLASGLSEDVDSSDTVFNLTRARLPWLLIGLMGGVIAASVIGQNEDELSAIPQLAFFIPLIAAMGGNVGVQSSAIVVQALANQTFSENIVKKLTKELSVGLVNGLICALVIFGVSLVIGYSQALALTVSLALLTVIIFASLFGTSVPLILDKYKIDPALATGPFITTANDVLGLFIYFGIGKAILGF
ncbi:magnesium transporter [Phaeocystidibacter marisrubri]|uniref:Magnesium transporter MgtE n=1 Tax=Phaeocystidibacter marisrubri TaxID=1577780 RepID=A0A6L3ZGD5_9FLAO|nr:magnesium transporter [Phaeocystidibacter marisrubri]KAB2817092.1 magnesium transporter [Phaeocystidibacter marisrubri]GGH76895.1 magnesium transporter MgtE [Phaeocystidibacter marisrubri]